jgi:adenine phosphoribosyltransferase
MTDLAGGRFAKAIRKIPDYPSQGILFYDLIPALADGEAFHEVLVALDESTPKAGLIAGVEARGFLFAAALAAKRGCGVLAIRKAGKLPPPVIGETYALEYGQARIEIPVDGIELAGQEVLLLDDLLATGGTLAAAAVLLAGRGARVLAAASVVELPALGGRARLAEEGLDVVALLSDDQLR